VVVTGDASTDLTSANLHRVTAFGDYRGSNQPNVDLGFYYQGEQFMLSFAVANLVSPPVAGALGGFPIQGKDKTNQVGIVHSAGGTTNVAVAKGEASGYHRIAFDSGGVLFLDPKPVGGGSVVIDGDTGEAIPTAGLTAIGKLPYENGPSNGPASVNRFITTCIGNGGACNVVYWSQNEPLRSPVAGTLTCLPPEDPYHPASGQVVVYEIDAGGFRLHVREERPRDPAECSPHAVAPGDVISPAGHYTLTARDADGLLTSLVAGEDGTLYAGHVDAFAIRCPCSTGN
jgi:hypothetical protein